VVGTGVRRFVRTAAEVALVGSGLTRWAARGRRGRTLVLAYHNVVDAGDEVTGDRSLHLDLDRFRAQLDLLQEAGTVVPLASISEPSDPDSPPRFVITFDDAYRGAVLLAVRELRARGLPATIFVPPGLLGTDGFWWDAVPVSGWEDPAPLGALRGEDARIRAWARENGLSLKPVPAMQRACSFEELAEALPDDLVTLGCHTWDHPNLARLTSEEVEAQMSRTIRWLEEASLPWTRWVSYPYGLASEAVRRVTEALEFEGGLRVDGGWMGRTPQNRLDLPRFNVPAGLSDRGFRIVLSGLRPT
jgi:peptidoglycan/xylan/chitin deacetylase (PgdA/CDA1 family)